MNIIGHKHILSFFEKVQKAGNLSHAYCFVGIEGLGKKAVAMQLGQALLGVSEKQFITHPDVKLIGPLVDEKTGKTKKNISVEQMRDCKTFLHGKPFIGKHKIVLIDPADSMSLAASNGLLKSLEEPSPHSIIFLVTTDHAKLPQTIQSRCQHIFFGPVVNSDMVAGLEDQGVPKKHAEVLAIEARGCPGKAIAWARDGQLFEQYQEEVKRFESLFGKALYEKMGIIEPLLGDKKDHIGTRKKINEALSVWELVIRDTILKDPTRHDLRKVCDRVQKAKVQLSQNIHPKLLLEHILLAIE